ncbi:Oidioi.mRNA.OKI2018_I69.PAR.g9002.t1.cds [Oikopleura dioica]|uniref:Carbohydrate sulfotransferase n=1 Tax=Oikopleura dioica TaxID=34765 RepID=A0ABN7RIK2_OIKDI|nr:Oidioi.mRNA.OKI2018_I69.PAR.g9002.t1.cds [Oikopleura dioica]
MVEIFQIGSITGCIVALLLFTGYVSQDYFVVETERIQSLTVHFLPGELEEDMRSRTKKMLNTTIDQQETKSEDKKPEEYEIELKEEPTEETDDQKFERIEKVQQERIQRLENFCKAYPYLKGLQATIWYSALYEETVICLNPKSGSTNLMDFIWYWINGEPFPDDSDKTILHDGIKPFESSMPKMKAKMKSLLSKRAELGEIFTVRDPLSRFLASWRDKVETERYPTYHRNRRDSFFYYKKITTPVLMHKKMAYVKSLDDWQKESGKDATFGLTFCDYVDYYSLTVGQIGKQKVDYHLEEQWRNCGVCYERYRTSFIGNTETYDDDLWYLFTKFNFRPPENSKSSQYNAHRTNTNSETLRDYFSPCKKSSVENLIKRYAKDYHAFGYKPEYPELGIKVVL